MAGRDRHPGDRLAALADGRLAEPERSRVGAHLAECPRCLAEYDTQLAMKGLLGGLSAPGTPGDLSARLTGLAADPHAAGSRRPPATRPRMRGGHPPQRSRRARVARAGAVGSVAAMLLVGVAWVAGGSPSGPTVVPPVDRYVREHAAVSVGVPLTEPALSQLAKGLVPLATQPAEAVTVR
jgi:anti-sigma factor RsiW